MLRSKAFELMSTVSTYPWPTNLNLSIPLKSSTDPVNALNAFAAYDAAAAAGEAVIEIVVNWTFYFLF